MEPITLVRYGRMGHVGRFACDPGVESLGRGEAVVVRTARGTELGEVLSAAATQVEAPVSTRILRLATADDVARSLQLERERSTRLADCDRVFSDGTWPILLLDVEPLLDESRMVLTYLGPHGLDVAGLRDALRQRCGIEAVFEPAGRDAADQVEPEPVDFGCGSCGSGGGCGSGGCGSEAGEVASRHGGGCSGCSVKDLVRRRKRPVTALG